MGRQGGSDEQPTSSYGVDPPRSSLWWGPGYRKHLRPEYPCDTCLGLGPNSNRHLHRARADREIDAEVSSSASGFRGQLRFDNRAPFGLRTAPRDDGHRLSDASTGDDHCQWWPSRLADRHEGKGAQGHRTRSCRVLSASHLPTPARRTDTTRRHSRARTPCSRQHHIPMGDGARGLRTSAPMSSDARPFPSPRLSRAQAPGGRHRHVRWSTPSHPRTHRPCPRRPTDGPTLPNLETRIHARAGHACVTSLGSLLCLLRRGALLSVPWVLTPDCAPFPTSPPALSSSAVDEKNQPTTLSGMNANPWRR